MMKDSYNKILYEGKILANGSSKGSFILLPNGWIAWNQIQQLLDKKFARHGVQNVNFPTLIPYSLLKKETAHIAGFNPECFFINQIGEKRIEERLVLRPTSEVLFYDYWAKAIHSYQQLPVLYNQWCQVFRAEKNTKPLFRNTEFFWQEGHTIHSQEIEAQELVRKILFDYQDYVEKILCIATITGKKTEGEKFAGAQETYTVECLLPDGQCLQLATSHYLGSNFTGPFAVKFRNKENQLQNAYSTSWGTSSRGLGALVATHTDSWGLIFPFDIAPVQVAFILVKKSPELVKYYQEICDLLKYFRCKIYDESSRVSLNILQADKEGCPLKIILGPEELKKGEITLIRRDNVEKKIVIDLTKLNEDQQKIILAGENYIKELAKINWKQKENMVGIEEKMLDSIKKGEKIGTISGIIFREKDELQNNLFQKSVDFRDKHIFSINGSQELAQKVSEGIKGLFLVNFCNIVACEENFKKQFSAYSIRCISLEKKPLFDGKCFLCQAKAQNMVYLGRSY